MISAAKNIQSSRGFKEKGVETCCRIEKKGFFLFHIWNSYFNAISTIRDVEGSEKVYGHL